jgi:hypothetical protein
MKDEAFCVGDTGERGCGQREPVET